MKKLLAALLVLAMMLMGVAALAEGDGHELALVTDVGNIDDQSFNQSSYEGMVAFAEENGLTYAYYRPSEDSTTPAWNPCAPRSRTAPRSSSARLPV